MNKFYLVAVIIMSGLAAGCHKHEHADKQDPTGPPHGGTPVAVGKHKYNLEFVRDGDAGAMQAYLMDAHFEKFVSVPETNFTLLAKIEGREERAEFGQLPAIPPSPDGSSYQFAARGEWIKMATNFEALIPTITLKGRTYTNIAFRFPEGLTEEHDH